MERTNNVCKAKLKQLWTNCRILITTKVVTEKIEKKLRKIDSDATKKDMMADKDEAQNATEANQMEATSKKWLSLQKKGTEQ